MQSGSVLPDVETWKPLPLMGKLAFGAARPERYARLELQVVQYVDALHRRVPTGLNGDDGRVHFAGF
jgi:hypothetical protein